jgi:dihydrofolate synthase/folylpolyglutamate synthase
MPSYRQILERLYSANKNITVTYGLANSHQLHNALGKPMANYHIVHVAGTNGKGSVCFKVAKALEKAGHRTGLFTSPHTACFRERATINGEMISEQQVL